MLTILILIITGMVIVGLYIRAQRNDPYRRARRRAHSRQYHAGPKVKL